MANRVWAHFRPASEPLTPRITRQCSKKKRDRKSTRLNSSHLVISYAVFCFRKSTRLNSSPLVISNAVFFLEDKAPEGGAAPMAARDWWGTDGKDTGGIRRTAQWSGKQGGPP